MVGRVRISHSVTITCPDEGRFRAHLHDGAQEFTSFEAALAAAEGALDATTRAAAAEAGAAEVHVMLGADIRDATIDQANLGATGQINVEVVVSAAATQATLGAGTAAFSASGKPSAL